MLALQKGENKRASEAFQKYLATAPNSLEGLHGYVVASIRANKAVDAARAAKRLLELKPDEAEYMYLHGAASLQANDLESAERSLVSFLKASPNNSRGCLALGLVFAAQPDSVEKARRQMRNCLAIDPDNYEARYQLALSYKEAGETADAIGFLETVVAQKDDYALALRDLGTLYLQTSNESGARKMLERAVALAPKDADTHFQLSRLYNLIGERELARKHLKIFQGLRKAKSGGM